LTRYYDSTGLVDHYSDMDGLPRKDVRALAEDSSGRVWIGTGKGLAWLSNSIESMAFKGPPKYGDPENISRNKVRAIAETSAGQIVVGTEYGLYSVGTGGFATLREGKDDDIPDVRALCGDGAGNLWVGTFAEGLTLYSNRQFFSISTTKAGDREPIWTIYRDRDGVVWFAGERGLKWLEDNAVKACSTEHGLPGNIINQIVDDDLGYLWLGLERGICRIAKREFMELSKRRRDRVNPIFFDESDGMPSSEMGGQRSQPAAIKRRKGDLWFATAKGVAMVDPRQIEAVLRGPRVVIESLRASDNVLYEDERVTSEKDSDGVLTVPAERGRILEMHFAANTFIASEKCRFKFRLDGYDTDWHDAGERRVAFYTNLSPGRYRFRVQASNHRNVWSEDEATLAFVLAPFYYQTWTFRISIALMLAAVVFGIHHYRVRHLQQLEQLEGKLALADEKNRLAQDLHDGIGGALTQLRLLAALAEREQAKSNGSLETIRKIGGLTQDLNHNLREIVWLARLESQTVEGVLLRAAEQAEEMAKAAELKCSINLPPRIPEIHLPAAMAQSLYFAIKEALNNAVKHARASSIGLKATIEDSVLRVSISDDGEGIRTKENGAASTGMGLRGMRERLNGLGGECVIQTKEGEGVEVALTLGINPSEKAQM
jgi:signal transduction histidine kinase